MLTPNDHDIVILSDFHMSSGYDARTGTFHRNEDFFYDDAFGRFLDHLIKEAEDSHRLWRLIVLGDFFDFLQVPIDEEPASGATSSEASVLRLERIGTGHSGVFAALARFVRAGHHVDFVYGNHDIELVWPDMQVRVRQLVAALGAGDVDLETQIVFHAWIVYIPGLLYAEHGQQYDGINSFATLTEPFLPDAQNLIELPLGSFFVRYMFNHIEQLDPFSDNVKPPTRYIGWALRNHPAFGLFTTWKYAQFFVRALPKRSSLTSNERRDRRELYSREILPRSADTIGLPVETLVAIDGMASIPALSSLRSQLNAILFRPLIPAALLVAAVVGVYQVTRPLSDTLRRTVRGLAIACGLAWHDRQKFRPASDSREYLMTTAQRVNQLLTESGHEVPVYVFGHTHSAAHARLGAEDGSPHYFNTGTWTPIVPESISLLSSRELFTFVRITINPSTGEVVPRLLVWNDASGREEPLPLLATTTETEKPTIVSTIRDKAQAAL